MEKSRAHNYNNIRKEEKMYKKLATVINVKCN